LFLPQRTDLLHAPRRLVRLGLRGPVAGCYSTGVHQRPVKSSHLPRCHLHPKYEGFMRRRNFAPASALFILGSLALGCRSDSKSTAKAAAPPPLVAIIEVSAEDVPIYHEYAAQTYARDM